MDSNCLQEKVRYRPLHTKQGVFIFYTVETEERWRDKFDTVFFLLSNLQMVPLL